MNNSNLSISDKTQIYGQIKEILTMARAKAYSAINFAMVEAYWLIGKQIVEAQAGNERAEYGTQLLKYLSQQLTHDFGKGFEERELRKIRQFYLTFPPTSTVCIHKCMIFSCIIFCSSTTFKFLMSI